MPDVTKLIITESTSIRAALQQLDSTAVAILLVVDNDQRLRRTVTDGDIRRLLLSGANLDDHLTRLPALIPKTARQELSDAQALDLMNQGEVDHLPVVDQAGRPVGLLRRRDLDTKILLSTPHLGPHEWEYVEQAFSTNWIAPLGPNVDAFERELAEYVGAPHAAAVSSGTAAIHLGLDVMGVKPGDTVFCSSLTFIASANPVLYLGARPVFIDSEPGSWNMSPTALAAALAKAERRGQLPRAVIVVNLFGQSADLDTLNAICAPFGVPILEDAAESLGASYKDRQSGISGEIGVFSFNGNKIITTSGGGMLVARSAEKIERAKFLATQARDKAPYYQHSTMGYNYRMSNILAGVGRGQLRVLSERVAARRRVFEVYRDELAGSAEIVWMPEPEYGKSNRWLSVFTLDPTRTTVTAEQMITFLDQNGIEARRVWKPLHLQPVFAGCGYFTHDGGPSVADDIFLRGVCLPSGSNMTLSQQKRIVRCVQQALSGQSL